VSLRAKVIAYLAIVHLLFAGLAFYLIRESPYWLFAVELVFAVTLGLGIRLVRRALHSLQFAADAARLMREDELTSRFPETGDADVDTLVAVYNRMVDRLRDERTRVQEQHNFFRQVVRASSSGLAILDFDGRVASLNPAAERLLDVTGDQVAGRSLGQLPSPLAGEASDVPAGTSAVVGLSGSRRVKIDHGTFVDRGFTRSFFTFHELTDEIRQVERIAYEKLIRVMSHEVNNSVTSSNSLLRSSLVYGSQLDANSRRDFERALSIVIDRTEQLTAFMRRFADVYRLPPPARTACDLAGLVDPIVRLLQARPDTSGIEWRVEMPPGPVVVHVDRGQIEQACLNVLKNAVEAAGPHGSITVRIRATAHGATLEVEDSGAGLSPEAQQNIFTPFFSTKSGGQGIGLTVVQEILTAHGCAFALEARPGRPTTFRVEF
jgi:nitrogen fixation/metabolism regulation signal transduction histidine kinase